MLAVNCALVLRRHFSVVLGLHSRNVSIRHVSDANISLSSSEMLKKHLVEIKPDVVIHTAGMTNVDGCEKYPERAFEINRDIAENVATACCQLGIKLCHISTDHLYAGDKSFMTEQDDIHPLNIYAESKAAGEQRVLSTDPSSLVIRTNFFGWGTRYRKSFSDFIFSSLKSGETVTLYKDIFFTPVLIERLCVILVKLIKSDARGIYNVTGDERVSKYDFGLRLADYFELDDSLVCEGYSGQLNANDVIQRPLDMSLCNNKTSMFIGETVGGLTDFFLNLKRQKKTGVYEELRLL